MCCSQSIQSFALKTILRSTSAHTAWWQVYLQNPYPEMWSLLLLGLENKFCLHSVLKPTATAVLDVLLLRWGRKTLENLTK